ncbi:hypothetical protein [Clostridium botulinum]|uniref:hypothetical protein n=1 Tax=Clostridium botulinum TaxID=1491 RepID=UPI0005F90C05
MKTFNMEELLNNMKNEQICEFRLNEEQVPVAGFLTRKGAHELRVLENYNVLSHNMYVEILRGLEELYNITVNDEIFTLEKEDIIFAILSGRASFGLSITLRKSLKRNKWI